MSPQVWQVRSMTTVPRFTRQVGALPHFRHGVLKSMRSERDGNRPMVWCLALRLVAVLIGDYIKVVMVVTSGAVHAMSIDAQVGKLGTAFGLVVIIPWLSFGILACL